MKPRRNRVVRPSTFRRRQIPCWLLGLVLSLSLLNLGDLAGGLAKAASLLLPERRPDALSGSDFAAQARSLDLVSREQTAQRQILEGNIPQFLRRFCEVTVSQTNRDRTNVLVCFVLPDYLAVGSDEDYLLMPMSPTRAQALADQLGCLLPTRKLVDEIYRTAAVKLNPQPMPPGAAMTTLRFFEEHNKLVRQQRVRLMQASGEGAPLVAGHKKDVVISPRLETSPGKVAIYGWHRAVGDPIQPLYLGHAETWVDYSQCIRLVMTNCLLNGRPTSMARILADPELHGLLSDEGPIQRPAYASIQPGGTRTRISQVVTNDTTAQLLPNFSPGSGAVENLVAANYRAPGGQAERIVRINLDPDVVIELNTPVEVANPTATKPPILLILYALPNGNTIPWTVGRKVYTGDDWHFAIQHIGAQTRFLRDAVTNRTIAIAYLFNGLKSWPAWRKQHGDARIAEIVEVVKRILRSPSLEVMLNGHSGGGSFIFGYLNTLKEIPAEVTRIGFLDSNYAYDTKLDHDAKLSRWLAGDTNRVMCVLAYDDANALLDGKSFVSASGGTWGRSHAMLKDLGSRFTFEASTNSGMAHHRALAGRVQFLLKENPERKIYHTVQVEKNGFIHSVLIGTPKESQGYEYFGAAAYEGFISPARE